MLVLVLCAALVNSDYGGDSPDFVVGGDTILHPGLSVLDFLTGTEWAPLHSQQELWGASFAVRNGVHRSYGSSSGVPHWSVDRYLSQ